MFAPDNWVFLWQYHWLASCRGRHCFLTISHTKSRTWLPSRAGSPAIFRRCWWLWHPGGKRQWCLYFPFCPLQEHFSWSGRLFFFPFTLGVLIEFLVTLSPFNSEYQLLKFSDDGGLFSCGMQWIPRWEILITRRARVKNTARRQGYYKRPQIVFVCGKVWAEGGYFYIENFKLFTFCKKVINVEGFKTGNVFFLHVK